MCTELGRKPGQKGLMLERSVPIPWGIAGSGCPGVRRVVRPQGMGVGSWPQHVGSLFVHVTGSLSFVACCMVPRKELRHDVSHSGTNVGWEGAYQMVVFGELLRYIL